MSLNQTLVSMVRKEPLSTTEKATLLDQVANILIENFHGLGVCFLKDLHLSGWEKPLGVNKDLIEDETGDGFESLYGLFCDCNHNSEKRDPIDAVFARRLASVSSRVPNAMRRIWGVIDAKEGPPWVVATFGITRQTRFPTPRPERVCGVSIARATSLQLQEVHGFSFDSLLADIGGHIQRCIELHQESLNLAHTAQRELSFLSEWERAAQLANISASDDDIPY